MAAGLGALAACATTSASRGVELDPASVTAIELVPASGKATFCPGGPPTQLKAIVTTGGTRLATPTAGESSEGTIDVARLEWSSSLGQVDGEAHYIPPGNPVALLDGTVTVTARVAGNAAREAKLELAPTFDCGAVVDLSGGAGAPGAPGLAGDLGRAGRPGTAASPAENGELGGAGVMGSAGGPGQPGPTLEVALAYINTQKHGKLVLARVGPGAFLFDPAGKKLRIAATGGAGGQGGQGGAGGQGGEGGDAGAGNARPGNGSEGGMGGQGGPGGAGGPGGTFDVQFDQAHPELVGLVVLENPGGQGGAGGMGGPGGRGGKPGSAPDGDRGATGRNGVTGQSGARGGPGTPGPRADPRPADVRQLFAAEIGRGVPIDVGAP